MNVLNNIKSAKYYIEQLTNTAKQSKTEKQQKFYLKMINTFIDLVATVEKGFDVNQSPKSKPMPSSLDLEQAVLGAILNDGKSLVVLPKLSEDVFYKSEHKVIITAIKQLNTKGLPIDLLTVSDWLLKNEQLVSAGGDGYLITLTQKTASSAHIDYHVHILLQFFIRRYIINISNSSKEIAYDDTCDVFELIKITEGKFQKINGFIEKVKENGAY